MEPDQVMRRAYAGAVAACADIGGCPVDVDRLAVALAYTAHAESAVGKYLDGDGGKSRGLFHFWEPTADRLPMPNKAREMDDWRDSHRWSGYAAVLYVRDAIDVDNTWLLRLNTADVVDGLAWWRVLWRWGPTPSKRDNQGRRRPMTDAELMETWTREAFEVATLRQYWRQRSHELAREFTPFGIASGLMS